MINATYGERRNLAIHPNRFDEQVTGYDRNGNILSLQRWGMTGDSEYNAVDSLTLTYDGNQLRKVSDAVTAASYGTGTNFVNGNPTTAPEYTYDGDGNLTTDLDNYLSLFHPRSSRE